MSGVLAMVALHAPTFEFTINLGSIMISIVGLLIAWTVRRIGREARAVIHRFEAHEHMLDVHSDVLQGMGWAPTVSPFLGRRYSDYLRDHPQPYVVQERL